MEIDGNRSKDKTTAGLLFTLYDDEGVKVDDLAKYPIVIQMPSICL